MSAAEKLLTVAQAAERCQCSDKTIRRAIASGDLLAVRLGQSAKSDRIREGDLRAYWARRAVRQCQSQSEPTVAIKSPSATADERIARLLGTGRTPTRGPTSESGSRPSATLRLVGNRKD